MSSLFRSDDDAILWVGYADFLTTLVILFFVVAVVVARQAVHPASGFVTGTVRDAGTRAPLPGCEVAFGSEKATRLGDEGGFSFEMAGLTASVRNSLDATCEGYARRIEIVDLAPDHTTTIDLLLDQDKALGVRPLVLSGDALFDPGSARLKPQAIEAILDIGRKLNLQPNEVILVAGHTDDKPFPKGSGRDNWVLSGERASSAARVLTDPNYGLRLPACQVSIMGFGPSRPVEAVHATDPPNEIDRKRARNRRIEFTRLSGANLLSGNCAEP